MKKRLGIITILLILVGIFSYDRLKLELDQFIVGERPASAAQTNDDGVSPNQQAEVAVDSDHKEARHPVSSSSSSPLGQEVAGRISKTENKLYTSIAANRPRSRLRFIRSSVITGSANPSEKQIGRLKNSVADVTQDLGSGFIVFDADAISNAEVPFILYAAGDRDLSDRVRRIYERLGKTADAEQDGPGQPPTRSEFE
jgi:hypothetical protein